MIRRFNVPVVASLLLAGCVAVGPNEPVPEGPGGRDALALVFAAPVLVDSVRIASEPSVKVAADGTIFVVAPTGVIKYATRPQDALKHADKGIFQGAIWRSLDGGATFEFKAGLGPTAYHTAQPGGGDSDVAIDGAGRVYVTDQFGLFTESVQWSDDQGETWHAAKTTGSGAPPVDRQWLWPDPDEPGHVYMVYNGNEGVTVTETKDGGDSWSGRAVTEISAPPGPILALPGGFVAFTVFDGDRIVFVSSADAGATWSEKEVAAGHAEINDFFPGTFADKAGTVYVSWLELDGDHANVAYVFTKDRGATWSDIRVAAVQPGFGTFAWGVAGEAGRVAFSWYGAEDPAKEWYAHAAILLEADGDAPRAAQVRISDTPVRVGPPCQGGATCTSGRELGDFQMCAVAPDGDLVVAYVTVLGAEEGGRITFARIRDGPSLLDSPFDPWVV